jgi:GH25 family lysozyme M1 (1,4-beta-N-acetylmuramidase)
MADTVYAIDVSSHQPRDLTAIIQQHQPTHVICKMYLSIEVISQEHTRAQWRSAQASGCTLGGYVWCYRSFSPVETVREAVGLARSAGVTLPVLWLDCETYGSPVSDHGPDTAWLRAALAECERLGVRVGIYTGEWWVRDHFPGGRATFAEFNPYPLWLALYDGIPDYAVWRPFSGFVELAGKQWTTRLPSDTYELDRNVFRPEFTVPVGAEPPVEDVRIGYRHLRDVTIPAALASVGRARSALEEAEAALAEAQAIATQFGD